MSWRMWRESEEDRPPWSLKRTMIVADLLAADSGPCAQGFVEDDELRLVDEGLGQAGALEHARENFRRGQVGGPLKPDQGEELGDALALLRPADPEEVGREGQELPGRQVIVANRDSRAGNAQRLGRERGERWERPRILDRPGRPGG